MLHSGRHLKATRVLLAAARLSAPVPGVRRATMPSTTPPSDGGPPASPPLAPSALSEVWSASGASPAACARGVVRAFLDGLGGPARRRPLRELHHELSCIECCSGGCSTPAAALAPATHLPRGVPAMGW